MKTYRAIEQRLIRLEQQSRSNGAGGYELWLDDDDGWLLGPTGERITQAEFDARYPDPIDIGGVDRPPLRVVINRLPPRGEADEEHTA